MGSISEKEQQRRYRLCHEETAQDQGDRVPEQAEAWGEVAVDVRAEVLGRARAATVSVPSAGKNPRINWGPPAMSNDVPSVGLR